MVCELCIENRKKYLQSYGTPFVEEPLLTNMGLTGNRPAVQSILEGTHEPTDGVDDITKQYISQLQFPPDYVPPPDCPLTVEDHRYDLKHTPKSKSSLPSGLHYGLWKAKGIDVEILKEDGNFNIKRLQKIVQLEGDHQFDSKRLGQ
eukprot:11515026-Ditylum_brightwellii.AAC.1